MARPDRPRHGGWGAPAPCAPCTPRLEATRRLVGGLRVLRPAPPPPDLPARLEGRIAAERAGAEDRPGGLDRAPGLRSLRSVLSWLWWRGLPPLHGSWSAARPLVTAGLGLLVAVLLLQNGESGLGLGSPAPKAPHAGPEV